LSRTWAIVAIISIRSREESGWMSTETDDEEDYYVCGGIAAVLYGRNGPD